MPCYVLVGSNNTAELTAIGEGFRWLAERCRRISTRSIALDFGCVVCRYDSDYAAKSVTGEYNGKKNVELIQRVRREYQAALTALRSMCSSLGRPGSISIRFLHVKGHSGHRWNNHADKLANKGITCRVAPELDCVKASGEAHMSHVESNCIRYLSDSDSDSDSDMASKQDSVNASSGITVTNRDPSTFLKVDFTVSLNSLLLYTDGACKGEIKWNHDIYPRVIHSEKVIRMLPR